MIIMINGSFGSGKTTAANLLLGMIPDSMVFDPEEVGYMLRKIVKEEDRLKEERTDDFQDIELWRILTVNVAKELRNKYNKHLIVPMTIYKIHNFEYIYNGFKEIESHLFHFCLVASKETLQERMMFRGDVPGGWTFQQIRKCSHLFTDGRFEEHIFTDHMNPEAVVERILTRIAEQQTGGIR